MRKPDIIAACVLICLIPSTALANMYVPSLVEMLVAPGPCAVSLMYAIIAVPILLAIAFIEALAIRPVTVNTTLWVMMKKLFWLNLITTFAGLVYYRIDDLGMWPGVASAFLATTLLEWALLFRLREHLRLRTPGGLALIALRMNSASYAIIALVLLLFIAPTWKYTDRTILQNLTGTIHVTTGYNHHAISRNAHTGALQYKKTQTKRNWQGQTEDPVTAYNPYTLLAQANRIAIVRRDTTKPLQNLKVENNSLYRSAFSADGRYLFLSDTKSTRLIDSTTGIEKKIGSVYMAGAFAPTGNLLAMVAMDSDVIALYNYATSKTRTLRIPGTITSYPGWSPDGQYIAYVGQTMPNLKNHWNPEIRIIRIHDGKSVTVRENIFTAGAPGTSVRWEE